MTNNIIDQIRNELETRTDRSAWNKGVTVYAQEILDTVAERAAYEGHEPQTREEFIDYMLNGAQDYHSKELFNHWEVASWGGCYLIYDGDIAARLCTPSELKKTRDGERRPNAREEWLDVQARALYQAGNRLLNIYRAVTAA